MRTRAGRGRSAPERQSDAETQARPRAAQEGTSPPGALTTALALASAAAFACLATGFSWGSWLVLAHGRDPGSLLPIVFMALLAIPFGFVGATLFLAGTLIPALRAGSTSLQLCCWGAIAGAAHAATGATWARAEPIMEGAVWTVALLALGFFPAFMAVEIRAEYWSVIAALVIASVVAGFGAGGIFAWLTRSVRRG